MTMDATGTIAASVGLGEDTLDSAAGLPITSGSRSGY